MKKIGSDMNKKYIKNRLIRIFSREVGYQVSRFVRSLFYKKDKKNEKNEVRNAERNSR